jgi:hypothetical protein
MVEFTRTVQIGWFVDSEGKYGDAGMRRPHLRELARGEPAHPQAPDSCSVPREWVDAFLRDMPNASILYRDRLEKWFEACWSDGYNCALMEGSLS